MPRKRQLPTLPHEMIDTKTEDLVPVEPPRRKFKLIYIFVIAIGLTVLLFMNKGLIVAAIVNGKPIFRWSLNGVLVSRFGQQTLEGMISEQLIADAARDANIRVTQEEIDQKEIEIVGSLGNGVSLDELLKYQGMSKSDFDGQIKLQMTVQKLLGKDITITDSDIDNFIATNQATLRATEPAALKEEARAAILEQKVGEKIQPWFLELKQKAQILRFL